MNRPALESPTPALVPSFCLVLALAAIVVNACAQAPRPRTSLMALAARPARRVVISLPDRKLAVIENGRVLDSFHVAVGARVTPSPTGTFVIVNHLDAPNYYHHGKVIHPGAHSPIGTRWMGLSKKSYGIHGTDAPRSIGHAASHGCIRLRNQDVQRLFTELAVGDTVEIHGERDATVLGVFQPTTLTAVSNAAVAGGQ